MGRIIYEGYLITLPDKLFQETEKSFEFIEATREMNLAFEEFKRLREERNKIWGAKMVELAGDMTQYPRRKM